MKTRKRKGTLKEQQQRDKFTAMRSFLRRCWQRWPERQAAKEAAKFCYKEGMLIGNAPVKKGTKYVYKCAECIYYFVWRKKEVVIDHIVPCGTFLCDDDYKTFIPGLFCDRSNLQVLCCKCHKIKTDKEKKEK